MPDNLPTVLFPDRAAFASWLAMHHAGSPGLWLQLGKKGASVRSPSYAEAVEVALAWGWIDSQKRSHDAQSWLQRFTPRGVRSLWSKINREKVEAMIARGEMFAPGLAEVERARADGCWEAAYAGASQIEVPEEFARALAKNRTASAAFEALDGANRYAMLFRLHNAKKPETRTRNIERFIDMLTRGETLHPTRKKPA